MLNLIPEEVNFQISTTDILVKYSEREPTKIKLDILHLKDYIERKKYTSIEIRFAKVAELRCTSLNFYESHYKQYEVFNVGEGQDDLKFWKENGYNPDSGFYQVDSSSWLSETKSKYDPRNNLGLKHFLIVGNDSYVELLAVSYKLE